MGQKLSIRLLSLSLSLDVRRVNLFPVVCRERRGRTQSVREADGPFLWLDDLPPPLPWRLWRIFRYASTGSTSPDILTHSSIAEYFHTSGRTLDVFFPLISPDTQREANNSERLMTGREQLPVFLSIHQNTPSLEMGSALPACHFEVNEPQFFLARSDSIRPIIKRRTGTRAKTEEIEEKTKWSISLRFLTRQRIKRRVGRDSAWRHPGAPILFVTPMYFVSKYPQLLSGKVRRRRRV